MSWSADLPLAGGIINTASGSAQTSDKSGFEAGSVKCWFGATVAGQWASVGNKVSKLTMGRDPETRR